MTDLDTYLWQSSWWKLRHGVGRGVPFFPGLAHQPTMQRRPGQQGAAALARPLDIVAGPSSGVETVAWQVIVWRQGSQSHAAITQLLARSI